MTRARLVWTRAADSQQSFPTLSILVQVIARVVWFNRDYRYAHGRQRATVNNACWTAGCAACCTVQVKVWFEGDFQRQFHRLPAWSCTSRSSHTAYMHWMDHLTQVEAGDLTQSVTVSQTAKVTYHNKACLRKACLTTSRVTSSYAPIDTTLRLFCERHKVHSPMRGRPSSYAHSVGR